MKKLLALLLAAVMCFSLVACGGNGASAEKAVLGAWNKEGGYDICLFSDDGKVARGNEQYEWWYDKGAERYCMSCYGLTYTFVIEEDETGRFFSVEGIRYYYIENYDPEKLKAEYIQKQIVSLTEGKTELVVGNTYTTANGAEFTFEKAEITGETDCFFNLYITSEEQLRCDKEAYHYFGGRSSFGIGSQSEGNEGKTRRYAGCSFKSLSELEAHKDQYGFLCFTIDETAYYVAINTFFE
ncbi:MAG: hypothetical protein E7618_03530 [Ruminococcaceae bacterium]|nr:hypothetical protein [Oscillospiraceae bacterium]